MNNYKVFYEAIMTLIKEEYELEINYETQTSLTDLILIISFKINGHTITLKVTPNFDIPINKIIERIKNEIDNLILQAYKSKQEKNMIDINKNNRLFAEMLLELLEEKYDIPFTLELEKEKDKWSSITFNFTINTNRIYVSILINYELQVIDGLFRTLSEKIDKEIIKSYTK